MEQRKRNAAFWLKGLLWLLGVMFVFTILSKAADSLTVAKVSVNSPSARKIQYTVSAEGRIEKNREISVLTQPDILVKSVLVSEGQHVKKKDVLAKLDMQNLREQIDNINDEKKVLELQNQAAGQSIDYTREKQSQELKRAKSDYEQIRNDNKEAAAQAKGELERAKDALKKKKEQNRQDEQDAQQIPITSLETYEDEEQEDTSLAALQEEVNAKKKVYKELQKAQKEEEKAAKRAVEDARSDAAADNSIEVNNIAIRKLELKLDKLYELEGKKGRILAPKDGVITSVLINVGQKTMDSGIFTMTDDSAGLKFVGQLTKEDAKYVSAGDAVTLHTADEDVDGITVTSMEMDESREFMNITALLLESPFSFGELVSMSAVKESKNYPCTVPITALHQEDGKTYIYLVQTEETVLGEQTVARKMEVKVLESNETYAALEDGAISDASQIITDTDRYIKAGDRIRLQEE